MNMRLFSVALVFLATSSAAQVSNVEGLTPLEGVVIPKVNQPQAVKPGAVFKDCDECPEMVVIPAGSFMMGSPNDADDPFSNSKPVKIAEEFDKPQHRVNIQSFSIGKYEVTQEQWFAVMGNNPSYNKGRRLPVESVSWDDAQVFVQKLSQKTGKKYRLPSEAEWEYAARAGSTTTYPWGNSDSESHVYAWFSAIAHATNPVGIKKPNQFGLYDMIGNAWEWAQDCWNGNYSGAPTDGSAWIRGDCSGRVLRGGSWDVSPQRLRAAGRSGYPTASRDYGGGFRVAMSIETSVDRAIRLEDEAKHKEEIAKRKEEEAKRKEEEAKRKEEEAKRKEEEAKRLLEEKKEKEQRRQEQVKRLRGLQEASTGPTDKASAAKASAPSGTYLGRLRAKVRPNITFSQSQLQSVSGNPEAEVEVTCSRSGQMTSKKLIRSSGNSAWDEAVMNAIEKTGTLPLDENGNVPPKITFGFRPRD